jgi:hypothetical protein
MIKDEPWHREQEHEAEMKRGTPGDREQDATSVVKLWQNELELRA